MLLCELVCLEQLRDVSRRRESEHDVSSAVGAQARGKARVTLQRVERSRPVGGIPGCRHEATDPVAKPFRGTACA